MKRYSYSEQVLSIWDPDYQTSTQIIHDGSVFRWSVYHKDIPDIQPELVSYGSGGFLDMEFVLALNEVDQATIRATWKDAE